MSVGFFDALFTSTSCVCVTGLVVVDTGTAFSTFGHVVIILLIQIGGLGFMSVAMLYFMVLGKRVTLGTRLVIQESLNEDRIGGLVRMMRWVIFSALSIEGIGAITSFHALHSHLWLRERALVRRFPFHLSVL